MASSPKSHTSLPWSLDRRSLAVMRVAYALLILADLGTRCQFFSEHYAPRGGFPLVKAFELGLKPTDFCLHALNGTVAYQASLFALHAAAALLLLIGWRTRLVTVILFVMAVSLHHRNFLVLNGGDNWMRLMLFWAIFLPWGDRWSVDSLRQTDPIPNFVSNVASFGYVTQILLIYFVSSLYKTGPAWREDGSAIYLALHQLEWSADLGYYFLFAPKALVVLSYSILLFEIVGPWLLICPWFFGPVRTLTALTFVGFHLGLAAGLELGIFPWVGVCSLLGLFPAWAWERQPSKLLEGSLDRVFRKVPWPKTLLESASLSKPIQGPWTSAAMLTVVVCTLAWNAGGREGETFALPYPLKVTYQLLALDQYWGLFSPEPSRVGGWIILEGEFSDGSVLDLRTGKAIDWAEPRSSSIYRTQRRKRWFVVLSGAGYEFIRPSYAAFLFRESDAKRKVNDPQLLKLKGHWLSRPTLPDFEDAGVPEHRIFMEYSREDLDI